MRIAFTNSILYNSSRFLSFLLINPHAHLNPRLLPTHFNIRQSSTLTMASYSRLAESSTDPKDKNLVIREVIPGIITFSIPFARFGLVPIGGRSTAIRLSSGDTFVYVSHPLTPATKEALKQLGGEIKWLVTPDGEHSLNIEAWSKAFPQAKPIGLERHEKTRPNVKWAGLFGKGGESLQYGFEPEVTLHRVSVHVNDELVAIHHPSGTLLNGDMLFNLPPHEQYSRSGGLPTLFKLFGSGSGMSPGHGMHDRLVSSIVKDKELAKKELQPIISAKWDRIIPCHGDVIETGGRAQWDKVWGKYA